MHVLDVAWSQGFRSVYWTVDALDWKEGVTAGEVSDRILNNLNPGTIYLMHVGDTITGQILDEMLSAIQSRGYEITSLTGGL
jgi:peptidoglycan/xylan/chitin deacetylase (PgdA/CDA1 family)